MNRKTLIITTGVGVALLALLAWAFAPRPVEVEVATASLGSFETSIDEDARTRLQDRFSVSAPLAGRLQRIALREGDRVVAGDVLARLTPVLSPMLDDRTAREQRARIASAEARRASNCAALPSWPGKGSSRRPRSTPTAWPRRPPRRNWKPRSRANTWHNTTWSRHVPPWSRCARQAAPAGLVKVSPYAHRSQGAC